MKTLSDIARERGISPQAVAKAKVRAERKYGEIAGIKDVGDSRRILYNVEDQSKILEFCGKKLVVQPPEMVKQLVEQPENYGVVTYTPDVVSEFDVGTALQRLDGAMGVALDDSEAVVDATVYLLDTVALALESKIQVQQQKVAGDRNQLFRLDAAKSEFQRRTAIAAIRSQGLAKDQHEVTQQIQNGFEEVSSLGKQQKQ